jgi:hypothetical protein
LTAQARDRVAAQKRQMQVLSSGKRVVLSCAALAMLGGCGGSAGSTVTPLSNAAVGQRGVAPLAAACENGRSGKGTETPRTQFTANGRYIELRVGAKAARKFFVKGMAYSPTPIGNGVSDPPSCDDPLRNNNRPSGREICR